MPQGELAKSLCPNTALGSVTTSSWSWGVIGSWGRCLVGMEKSFGGRAGC